MKAGKHKTTKKKKFQKNKFEKISNEKSSEVDEIFYEKVKSNMLVKPSNTSQK